jgi:hypothetical protein
VQNRGNRLLDGGIGGIVKLQQTGKAGLKIRLRTIEAGERNHGIPALKIGSTVWPGLYRFLGFCRVRTYSFK